MQSAAPQSTLSPRRIAITGILAAVAILLGMTRIGFIPVPNPSGSATIMHIPAILAGVIEGPVSGLLVGGIFGIYSFVYATVPFFKDPLVSILPRLFIGITPYFAYRLLRNLSRPAGYSIAAILVLLTLWFLYLSFQFSPEQPRLEYAGIALEGDNALRAYQIMAVIIAILGVITAWMLVQLIQKNQVELLAVGMAAIVGTLTNTVLVVGMLIVRGWFPAEVIIPAVLPQAIAEVIIAVVLTVAIVAAWKRIETGTGGSSV